MKPTKQDRIIVCFETAKKYTSRSQFFKLDHNDYCYLQKQGLLKEACGHMPLSKKYSYAKWTHAAAMDESAKYNSRSEFKRSCAGAYEYALSNGFLDQACAHMRDGKGFWHVFELMAVAIKYDNWSLFIKNEPQAYSFANGHRLIGLASSHMSKKRVWDKESVIDEAKKYSTKSMFFALASGAYKHAFTNGYADEVFAHMDIKKRELKKDDILSIAKIHNTRSEFLNADPSAYALAQRNGYINEACSHMEIIKRQLDREFVLTEAKKFTSRSHFKLMEAGCYHYAKRNGFLEECCAHMKLLPSGFKDAGQATMYHLRITGPCGVVLYKIGITNRTPRDRIQSLYLHEGFSAEILDEINFDSGRDARIAEKRLHRSASAFRYNGPPVMSNGNTELFTENVFLS